MLQENPGSRKTFRLQSKGWFLTYPRCSLSKEDAMEQLKALRKGLKQVLVSRELHEDGEPHLHCYLYYGQQFDCKNERFFDLGSYHPNIQVAKSLRAVQAYVKKDGDFIQEGMDYAQEVSAIKAHSAVIAKRLIDGESLVSLTVEHPELLFKFRDIQANLYAFNQAKVPVLPRCSGFIPNSFGHILTVSHAKDSHYWFWSTGPNKGKTTFLKSLESQFPCLWYNKAEKYQEPKPHAQFVLLDEYSTGHLTVTQLNEMCDRTYQYPVKGSTPFQLPNCQVLICGNRNPLEIYDEKHHELIKARFNIICLG